MLRVLFQACVIVQMLANLEMVSAQCYIPGTQAGCPGGVSEYCQQKTCARHWYDEGTDTWVQNEIEGADTMVRCVVDETLQHAATTGLLPKAEPLTVNGTGKVDTDILATVTCVWESQCSCADNDKAIGAACGGGTQSPVDSRVPTQPDPTSDGCTVTITQH
jgi:hypothetical protein